MALVQKWVVTLILLSLLAIEVANGQQDNRAQREALRQYLYSKCPALNSLDMTQDSLDVSVQMNLQQFLGISNVDQVFSNMVTVSFMWQIPCANWLHFNTSSGLGYSSAWSGIGYLPLNLSQLFYPKITSVNNAADINAIENMQTSWDTILYANGSIMSLAIGRLDVSCNLNAVLYPYDSQNCSIILEPFYGKKVINLIASGLSTIGGYDSYVGPTSLWKFVKMGYYTTVSQTQSPYLSDSEPRSQVVFWVYLSRRISYYQVGILAPYLAISVLLMPVLLMEPKDTNRPVFSATLMFSLAIVQSSVMLDLPKTSSSVYLIREIDARLAIGAFMTLYTLFMCWFARLASLNVAVPLPCFGNADEENKKAGSETQADGKKQLARHHTEDVGSPINNFYEISVARLLDIITFFAVGFLYLFIMIEAVGMKMLALPDPAIEEMLAKDMKDIS